jgi:hypothetical protein
LFISFIWFFNFHPPPTLESTNKKYKSSGQSATSSNLPKDSSAGHTIFACDQAGGDPRDNWRKGIYDMSGRA